MSWMFHGAATFNQPIGDWDVRSLQNITSMFYYATQFNQDLSNWDLKNIIQMNNDTFNYTAMISSYLPSQYIQKCLHLTEHIADANNQKTLISESINLLADLADDIDDINIENKDINNKMSAKKAELNVHIRKVTNQLIKLLAMVDTDEFHMTTLSEEDKQFIQELNNVDNYAKYAGLISVKDKTELYTLINNGIKLFGFDGNFNWIDTSEVTDMSDLFAFATNGIFKRFTGDISLWNTSNVNNMSKMFYLMEGFNSCIDNWDVSNVTNMSNMFYKAKKFNSPLNNWDVSSVTDMSYMFFDCTSFNQPLDNWDVSNVTNMKGMFNGAECFNQTINTWNISKVNNTANMFSHCLNFNQPLNNLDVSNVTTMAGMFFDCTSFNQPLDLWDVSNVNRFSEMFAHAKKFNQDLSMWQIKKYTDTYNMFAYTKIDNDFIPSVIKYSK